jgi:hypothetical protein
VEEAKQNKIIEQYLKKCFPTFKAYANQTEDLEVWWCNENRYFSKCVSAYRAGTKGNIKHLALVFTKTTAVNS